MLLHPDSENVIRRYGRLWTRTDGNAANCSLQCVLSLHGVLERSVLIYAFYCIYDDNISWTLNIVYGKVLTRACTVL